MSIFQFTILFNLIYWANKFFAKIISEIFSKSYKSSNFKFDREI